MNTKANAMLNLAYFAANYPSNFIEKAFERQPDLIPHLKGKFAKCYASDKPLGAVLRFIYELDEDNQETLLTWIDRNYTAFEDRKPITIEKVEDLFRSRYTDGNLKPKSKAFLQEQAAYFAGATIALNEVPPLWYFSILRGENIWEERQKINAKKESDVEK